MFHAKIEPQAARLPVASAPNSTKLLVSSRRWGDAKANGNQLGARREFSESLDPAERFRRCSLWLIAASAGVVPLLAETTRLQVDIGSAGPFVQLIAAGVLASAVAATKPSLTRIGDCLGALAVVVLSGILCGFISLMGLHLHFALVDDQLFAADRMLGLDDRAFVSWLSLTPKLVHHLMSLAYLNTVPILFGSLVLQACRRERTEVWRSVFCFTGSLLTVCSLSILTPAKGLGLWLFDADLARLPAGAARYFWPVFNRYYDGTASQIRIDSIGAVVSFPSFHVIMGLIAVMIWRRQRMILALALAWFSMMLPAAVALGGHYVVDLIGGFVIWVAWFAASRRLASTVT